MLLYLHIPFCDSKCFYCAFNSYTNLFHLKDNYMEALKQQLLNDLQNLNQNEKLETIFIGGGTPSCIKAHKYDEIFKILKPYMSETCEVTTEANPNSASLQWQEHMYNLGVNRISFGVQSFNDEKLKYLGRAHNKKSAIEAINNAKKVGFDSINCDIIYGVKNDTIELLKSDFDTIKELNIQHMSAYSLTIEEGTKFFSSPQVKIDDEALSQTLFDYLNSIGFKQYEISNFAINKKHQSQHNFGYWQHQNYLGVGCGAVGFINHYRYYPNKNIETYIQNPTKYEIEALSQEDMRVEKILLGLRCSNGVVKSLFSQNELEKIDDLLQNNKIYEDENRIYNNDFLLADELALYIIE